MFEFLRRSGNQPRQPAKEPALNSSQFDNDERRCPACLASFPMTYTICPHDKTLLTRTGQKDQNRLESVVASRPDDSKWELSCQRFLGSGSICDVYDALDNRGSQHFAVKALMIKLMVDKKSARKFLEGAKKGLSLQHKNIVGTLGFGSTNPEKKDLNRPFVVCDYLEGKPLSQLIDKHNLPSASETLAIANHVCAALEHAHEKGIIHGDLKPSNIFLESCGEQVIVKVSDFAIAERLFQGLEWNQISTMTSSLYGSAVYLAPDYVDARTPTEVADIYSLGCIMYECMTGQPPFLGNNDFVTIMKHVSEAPKPFSVEYIPKGFEALIMRALEKDPRKRWQSAAEMREAIAHLQA